MPNPGCKLYQNPAYHSEQRPGPLKSHAIFLPGVRTRPKAGFVRMATQMHEAASLGDAKGAPAAPKMVRPDS